MSRISKQSEFSRSIRNESKMGAYYTDLEHCGWISKFIQFPEEEVCCIDPSIGNGEAILTVTGKDATKYHIKIYGIELNHQTYQEVSKNPEIDQCMKADFLEDTLISHNSFSFAFVNPPYGTLNDKQRYEVEFLTKLEPYLTKKAVVVYVIPQYVCTQNRFAEEWCSLFDTCFFYRFHEKEYEKYKQVVLIGIKKDTQEKDDHAARKLLSDASEKEKMPLLPENYSGEKIKVAKSSESNIERFMTRIFHADEAAEVLHKSPLHELVSEGTAVPAYLIDNLERPPIMPSDGQMYLLAVSGAGQGLVGSEDNKDLHLQRGRSEIVKKSEYMQGEDGKMKEVEVSYPQIQFVLIENNGNIRTLQ